MISITVPGPFLLSSDVGVGVGSDNSVVRWEGQSGHVDG